MTTPSAPTAQRTSALPPHPWDVAAEGWDRHAADINAWLGALTQEMIETTGIREGSRVLDVAAGSGGQTHEIAARVGKQGFVLATDISERVITLARASAAAADLPQVRTLRADAQALGLEGADYDAAICRLGLMFCTEPQKALAGIAAALRPGGRFCALVFSTVKGNPCIATMMNIAHRNAGLATPPSPRPGSIFSLSDAGELARLLQASGFIEVKVRAVSAPFRMPSAGHYVEFVRSSGSPVIELVGRLPLSAQADTWADMARELHAFDTRSGWIGPNELLVCEGRIAA